MATRKGATKKGGAASGKRKVLWGLVLLSLLLATLLATFVLLILRPFEAPPLQVNGRGAPKVPLPHYEEGGASANLPVLDLSGRKGKTAEKPSMAPGRERGERELPFLAIVIDDMGYQQKLDEELLHLNLNLSFAFLPHGPHTAEQSEQAARVGREVLLHVPMEPRDHRWDPGPGALTLVMSPAERSRIFLENLALVPRALGVNNHMGSRFTSDRAAMRDFLALVRGRRLFFLDSATAGDSLAYDLALEMGVRAARRQVFLDNVRGQAEIDAQIRALLRVAEQQGSAVGIGHPYPETLAALQAARPEILRRTKLVGVSHLMR